MTYLGQNPVGVTAGGLVNDVKVDGTSVVTQGVANVPYLGNDVNGSVETWGIPYIKNGNLFGFRTVDIAGKMCFALNSAGASGIKNLVNQNVSGYGVIDSNNVDKAAFFGLALAAGANMAYAPNTVGTYTETAKSKISDMLNAPVSVSGSTPSITAQPGVRYICGECSTLSITVPESGIIDVTFTSGSTATVLTVTPPTGMTMKWVNGFDPTSLDANTVYEINIMDGCYGVVGSWT